MRAALASLSIAALAMACGAPQRAEPARSRPPAEPISLRTPARWLFTDRLGVLFDEGDTGAEGTRVEPAILDGVRVLVDAGLLVASARHAERFLGFRSLPARLGGGFVMWSEDRVYRAGSFLDEPKPIADLGAAGARPWLSSVILRTPSGLFDLDPAKLTLQRVTWSGIADAIAVDARRAVRLDALGRATVTTDGGATWADLTATRGIRVQSARLHGDELWLTAATGEDLRVGANGDLRTARDDRGPALPEVRTASPLLDAARPSSSRALAAEIVAQAIAWGAPLPGGRALVTRENGARVIAVETGLPVADADLPAIDERFAHCQAVSAGAPPRPLLLCSGETGAQVIALDGSLTSLGLEATFPYERGGFVVGPRGRLAFDGRCGPDEPRATDLGPGSKSGAEPMQPPTGYEPPGYEARVCTRGASATWSERRVTGDDARHLHRWIPHEDGAVTALVVRGKDDDSADEDAGARDGGAPSKRGAEDAGASEGVRVIRVDPDDPVLAGGAFTAVPSPQIEGPVRVTDGDFWIDDDGSVRGWLKLPGEGDEKVDTVETNGWRVVRVAAVRGGRMAGVRIDAAGKITVLALPEGTAEVVTGGRFALAMARSEGVPAWFESTDGGARWTAIEGPPVGLLSAPPDEHAPFACSELGCAFGNGVVRIGWGGPSPTPAPELTLAPAASPRPHAPGAPTLRCRLEGEPPWPVKKTGAKASSAPSAAKEKRKKASERAKEKHAEPAPLPVSLRVATPFLGELRDHAWSVEVVPPFSPAGALRRVSATDRALSTPKGSVVPLLARGGRDPVDLLLLVGDRRARAGGPATLLPFTPALRFGVAVEMAGGVLAMLDTDRDQVFLARGAAAAPAVRLTRVADPARTRITLAQTTSGGLAVVGYAAGSGEVFAGDLDLARAEVRPLAPLARLDALAEARSCGAARPTHRVLLELPVDVHLEWPGGAAPFDRNLTASFLVSAGADRLCVEGVEVGIPEGPVVVLSALMGKTPAASVRSGGKIVRATCTMPPARASGEAPPASKPVPPSARPSPGAGAAPR